MTEFDHEWAAPTTEMPAPNPKRKKFKLSGRFWWPTRIMIDALSYRWAWVVLNLFLWLIWIDLGLQATLFILDGISSLL